MNLKQLKKKRFYYTSGATQHSINEITGEVETVSPQFSMFYTNDEVRTRTRARRALARKYYELNPVFAYRVFSEAWPDYTYEEFLRDIKPTKGAKRGKVKYDGKKLYLKNLARFYNSLDEEQRRSYHWQMKFKDWAVLFPLPDDVWGSRYTVVTLPSRLDRKVVDSFIEWVRKERPNYQQINEKLKAYIYYGS